MREIEEERLLHILRLVDNVEELYLINSYYLFRNLENTKWKVDWKTLLLPFLLMEESTIADLLKNWSFLRHYKDISPRLPLLIHFGIVEERPGPKNSKILQTTTKGKLFASFFFYMVAFDNNDEFHTFDFLSSKFPELPGFDTPEVMFESLKVIRSQVPALAGYIPKIEKRLEDLNYRMDYKVLLIPLYLLDEEDQCYTDLINNYPQFGYYRELKQRIVPLVSLNLVQEQKAGRRGTLVTLTRKGKYLLLLLAYLMNFPNMPVISFE